MKPGNSQLVVLRQLDHRLEELAALEAVPQNGWIRYIRKALNMSLKQLGTRLSMSAQGARDIERREKEGSVTIRTMREAGAALGLRFVYGFVPQSHSFEKTVEDKARQMAERIVRRAAITMVLEDQANSEERLKQAVEELTAQLKREMPKSLWD